MFRLGAERRSRWGRFRRSVEFGLAHALVGIPIGRMQGDYRFSFILPLRAEMFRKVPHLNN